MSRKKKEAVKKPARRFMPGEVPDGAIVGALNFQALIYHVLTHELLMDKYHETGIFMYMLNTVRDEYVMLCDGVSPIDMVELVQAKLHDPTNFSMSEELAKLKLSKKPS